ncbi:MAG: elongation factor G [Myxococcota bacterium]|nr:elongation factor G [Myxococcota bacterium]
MANDPSNIRSFALVGHSGAGKTHTADAIARLTGLNNRLGSPSDQTSLFDFEPEEQKRGGSITSHMLACRHGDMHFNILDTPGDGNFIHDAQIALQAVDAAVLVVSAVDGVEVSTERMSDAARERGMPRAVFINKMDRERANHKTVLGDIKEVLGMEPVLLQLPIGVESGFRGMVDLVNRQALVYSGDEGKPKIEDIPADLQEEVEDAVESMIEAVAMADDELVEKYLEEGELSEEDVRAGLNKGILSGALCPVVIGSAALNIGADQLLRMANTFPAATDCNPTPSTEGDEVSADPGGPLAALCFKTIIDPFAGKISVFRVVRGTAKSDSSYSNPRTGSNERFGSMFQLVGKKQMPIREATVGEIFGVSKLRDTHTGDTVADPKNTITLDAMEAPPPMISYTVRPKDRGDEDKIKTALGRILAEDPGLRQGYDEVTKELVVSGMGANHVRLALDRMARKYGIAVELGTPTIPYRETIRGSSDVRYRHKKQSGGAGQFGEVSVRIEPNPGEGFEFVNEIVGGVIPGTLIPSVEKGVRAALKGGILAGFPVVDVKVSLYDGKTHPVDSKDIAFQIAGRQATKQGVLEAEPVLLEPIYEMTIVVPEDSVGDIMGDMNSRRGRIISMENKGRSGLVKVHVPLKEILNYSPDLNSMTGGKGSYTMQIHQYEPVPSHMQAKLVTEIQRLQEDED